MTKSVAPVMGCCHRAFGTWRRTALLLLIAVAFVVNFAEGISLGQRGALFYPMYRTRQTLAVALSMLRDPPAPGYYAYSSIVSLLERRGIRFTDNADDHNRITSLFRNAEALDDSLREALKVQIDERQQYETLKGNDLGYADYMYLAFKLFGLHTTSIYDLYFALLLIGAIAFAVQFHRSSAMLYLLSVYLAVHLFVLNYCVLGYHGDIAPRLGSIANSRTFSGLALLPTMHLMALILLGVKFNVRPALTALVQSLLLGFLILCRFDSAWELAAIVGTASLVAAYSTIRCLTGSMHWSAAAARLWPLVLVLIVYSGMQMREEWAAGPLYDKDSLRHVVWHEALAGLLSYDQALMSKYTAGLTANDPDKLACQAVNYYLDHSSTEPSTALFNCVTSDGTRSGEAGVFDSLARRMVVLIIAENPIAVLRELKTKFVAQIELFNAFQPLALTNIRDPALLWLATTLFFASFGASALNWQSVLYFVGATAVVLAFALACPAIFPTDLAIGTLMSYVMAAVLCLSAVALAIVWSLRATGKRIRAILQRALIVPNRP
jgi:hypothetical protein